ncbi:MAG TPA: Asd/ArgC dimerization domain-containing protein, partial [Candidatus Subteraquimicrobiales bacterium]
ILGAPEMRITATAVRVPVLVAHSEAVNVETEEKITSSKARQILENAPGVQVLDDPKSSLYPLPINAAGSDFCLVGRIREDNSLVNGLNLWIVADNLRKGAALNAVQIAEALIR